MMDCRLYIAVAYLLSLLLASSVAASLQCPYTNSTSTIDLSGVGITNVTNVTFTSVYDCSSYLGSTLILDLSNNNIGHVDYNSFSGFTDLKTINLSHNSISTIENGTFSTLSGVLEYLYLGYNYLTTLKAGLYNLYKLKEIHFEHNNISDVEAGVVDGTNLNLLYFNMQHNKLTVIEPWPYMVGYTNGTRDILFDLQHNLITRLNNTINWVYNLTHPYEVQVLLQYNLIETVTIDDLKVYKPDLEDTDTFALLLTLYMNITHNPYFCDCNLYFLANDLRSTILRWTRVDEFRYECATPSQRQGDDWFHDTPLYHLVCDRTVNCPANCSCQDRPHNDTFYVDCRGAGLTEFPDTIPDTERTKIEMLLDDNQIPSLKNTSYLPRLYNLSISNNTLSSLDEGLLRLMPNLTFLNVQDNRIRSLPSYIQRHSIDNIKLNGNPLFCDCDSLWLADWVGIGEDSDSLSLECDSKEGIQKIEGVNEGDLGCKNEDIIIMGVLIGCSLLLLLLIGLFVFRCPYESKVLLQKMLRIHPFDKYKVDDDECKSVDIYLVFDDDPDVIGWIKIFLNQLHKKKPHYKILNPYRFTEPGAQETQIRKWIGKSKRIIVVLSENIFQNKWRMFETDVAEDNLINALARNSKAENTEQQNVNIDEYDDVETKDDFDDIQEAGRIIYVKFNDRFKEKLKEDPWQKRLLDKTVLTVDERLFMSKLRYELPTKGNGTDVDDNFRIVPRREDIARLKEDKKLPARAGAYKEEDETRSIETRGLANNLLQFIRPPTDSNLEPSDRPDVMRVKTGPRMTVMSNKKTNNQSDVESGLRSSSTDKDSDNNCRDALNPNAHHPHSVGISNVRPDTSKSVESRNSTRPSSTSHIRLQSRSSPTSITLKDSLKQLAETVPKYSNNLRKDSNC